MSFSELGLCAEINHALDEQGYREPTPIQAKAIPAILAGRDIMAAAQTGTGKTAGFTLPMLELLSKGKRAKSNQVRALILTPTRELAAQVWQSVMTYSKHLSLNCQVVYGGVKINPQMLNLRKGADILVATPGRLLDLYQQNAVKFDSVELFVLDEADRMLDMGFIHDIKRTIALLPKKRQNLLFSATFSNDIKALAKGLIHDPVEISVAPANSTAKTVSQRVYPVDKSKRTALLCHLITHNNWQQVLVFTRTKHGANRLVKDLEKAKINAAAIHGNKSQSARMNALNGFKLGELRVLVATDIVARGLDIQELPYVVNFDLPNVYEDYVHRIGRTGRAGASGEAISFVSHDVASDLFGIERLIQELIPRVIEKGFEPVNPVAASVLDTRPIKAKKPKKPKKPKIDVAPLETDAANTKSAKQPKPSAGKKEGAQSHTRAKNKQNFFDAKRKKTDKAGDKQSHSEHTKPKTGKPQNGRNTNNGKPAKRKPNANKANQNKPNAN